MRAIRWASMTSRPAWRWRHAITLAAALLVASIAPRAFAQVRIAVVDLQRAMSETDDGRRAKRRLKKLFDDRQQELERRQHELEELSEEAQAPGLSEETRRERAENVQRKALELQQLYVQYQRELAEKEAELTSRIVHRMEDILRRLGQSEGYTMIVERSQGGVVFAPTNLDLTDVVIQRYEAGEGREAEPSPTTETAAPDPASTAASARRRGRARPETGAARAP
ncbi:MAG: OmpH family outer membrane protein [Sandaracinaceae bacterium]|nr:OmpH family outer membrane protein [Sandaracinaceae bacterium]